MNAMQALVFSNFPESLFDNELRPKLVVAGVNVVSVYKPDRADEPRIDCTNVDAVITFTDFMSHTQSDTILKKARRWGKPVIALQRRSSDWEKRLQLGRPTSFVEYLREAATKFHMDMKGIAEMTKVPEREVRAWFAGDRLPEREPMSRLKFVFPSLPHRQEYKDIVQGVSNDTEIVPRSERVPEPVKKAMRAFMGLVRANVDGVDLLEAMRGSWRPDLISIAQVEELFDRYVQTDAAPIDFGQWWLQYKKACLSPLPPPSRPRPSLQLVQPVEVPVEQDPPAEASPKKEEDQLAEALEMIELFESENNKLMGELTHCSKSLKLLNEERVTFDLQIKTAHDRALHFDRENQELKKKLEESQEMSKHLIAENRSIQERATGYLKKIEELEKRPALAPTGMLEKVVASCKSLVEAGVMTREEMGEKLVKHLLG